MDQAGSTPCRVACDLYVRESAWKLLLPEVCDFFRCPPLYPSPNNTESRMGLLHIMFQTLPAILALETVVRITLNSIPSRGLVTVQAGTPHASSILF